MLTDEARLGHADRRQTAHHPQVACESEPPGMRQALTVAQDDIRGFCELRKRLQDHRYLSKRQQPRDIREFHRAQRNSGLDDNQTRPREYRNRGPREARSPLESNVHSGHPTHPAEGIGGDDPPPQLLLDRLCLRRADVPAVA